MLLLHSAGVRPNNGLFEIQPLRGMKNGENDYFINVFLEITKMKLDLINFYNTYTTHTLYIPYIIIVFYNTNC